MATHNGAAHLRAQLASLVAQDHDNWSLCVGDDGSTDGTPEIIKQFRKAIPIRDIRLFDGPRRGSAANFLTLLMLPEIPNDAYVAFSDQDDIWLPHRLSRALECLSKDGPGQAYASRTILMDAKDRLIRPSRPHRRAPCFGNALVQNILAGNTVVLSPAAVSLARRAAPAALAGDGVPFHD